MSDKRDGGTMFFGGMVAGALILAAGYGISFDRALWLNETGLAEVAIGGMTLAALIFGAWQASRSFWLSRSAALSTRFKDAAQLLDGDDAAIQAGIALTAEVALENPEVYGLAAVRSLLAVSNRAEQENRKLISVDYFDNVRIEKSGRLPNSSHVGITAFAGAVALLNRLDLSHSSIQQDLYDNQLYVLEIYLAGYTFDDTRIGNIWLARSVLYRANFNNVKFANVTFHGSFASPVMFRHCDISGLKILGSDRQGNLLQPDSFYAPRFIQCTGIESATINGVPVTKYVEAHRRKRPEAPHAVPG